MSLFLNACFQHNSSIHISIFDQAYANSPPLLSFVSPISDNPSTPCVQTTPELVNLLCPQTFLSSRSNSIVVITDPIHPSPRSIPLKYFMSETFNLVFSSALSPHIVQLRLLPIAPHINLFVSIPDALLLITPFSAPKTVQLTITLHFHSVFHVSSSNNSLFRRTVIARTDTFLENLNT